MSAIPTKSRLRIAYFSPLPPARSGIATYSADLLPHLATHADLILFTDNAAQVDPVLQQQFIIREIDSFAGLWKEDVDICLYQMGNNILYHEKIYTTLLRFPGVVMLHDLNLHSFLGELYLTRGLFAAYMREMGYGYGSSGIELARQAHYENRPIDIQQYPLFERAVQTSLGVAVHSRYAYENVNGRCPQTSIAHIPHLQADLLSQYPSPHAAKAELGLTQDTILLSSFGYIAPSKRIEVALRAFAKLSPQYPQAVYALVGAMIEGYTLRSLITELNLENKVKIIGYADESTFQTYIAATDIGINLRYPSLGETSGTLLRLMGMAKPLLVSNVDTFVELPDDACIKIDVNAQEQQQIEAALQTLITDETARRQMGLHAHAYIQQECDPTTIAEKYMHFIRTIVEPH